MNADVERSLSRSARDFLEVVAPAIRCHIGEGRILSNEEIGNLDLRQAMDVLAGLDAWQLQDKQGRMRSIASRVQYKENYRSFTVRTRRASGSTTELSKRLEAFRQPGGWLFPALTVQAYLLTPGGALLGVGVVQTPDLFTYIESHPAELREEKVNHEDCRRGCKGPGSPGARCAWFVFYKWAELQLNGVDVRTIPPTRRRGAA